MRQFLIINIFLSLHTHTHTHILPVVLFLWITLTHTGTNNSHIVWLWNSAIMRKNWCLKDRFRLSSSFSQHFTEDSKWNIYIGIYTLSCHMDQFSSIQSLSRVLLFVTLWTVAHQASLSITNSWSLLKLMSIESVMPSNHLILCCPLLPQSFLASGSFSMSQFFAPGGQSIRVFLSASVLPVNIQDLFPLDGLIGSPWSPRDSQESSPTPQFKSINSLALSFLYSPTLTSILDYWKNHSFD